MNVKTTRVPLTSASMCKSFEWPVAESVEPLLNLTYNCLRYELDDGAQFVVSADVEGIYADGNSPEDAVMDFRLAIKTRLLDGLGGLYFGKSDFSFQDEEFLDLEEGWKFDDVKSISILYFCSNVFTSMF